MNNCLGKGCFRLVLHVGIFILVSFVPVQRVKSQTKVDSSFRFYYYDQKLSLFESMDKRDNAVVWLGDSITDGGEWGELFAGIIALNRGISADNTFGVLNRLYEVTRHKPGKIFLLIGINDIAKETPVKTILDNYRKIVLKIKEDSPDTEIWLQTLLPTNASFTDFPKHQHKEADIMAVNQGIKTIASELKTRLLDLHTAFKDESGNLRPSFTNDGLHLTGAGYQHWKKIILTNKALP